MIPKLTANVFHRFLETGRTSPGLFACETSTGQTDYVVKLRGGMERSSAPLCELYASLLAQFLGIYAPAPAIVLIEKDLTEAIADAVSDPRHADIIRNSVGWNFGSCFVPNISSWPVDKHVPAAIRDDATKIFAFDALIQNPDRAFINPNLGTCGNQLIIFDHELAFSFLSAIFPSREPWKLATETYLDNHVFVGHLKGERCSLDFTGRLNSLSDALFREFASQIPEIWNSEDLSKIEAHLRLMQEHAEEFAEEVGRRLA